MNDKPLFIFDFDGVIVDSIDALYHIYMDFLSEVGVKGNSEEFNLLNGPKLSEIVFFLKEKYAIQKSQDELFDIYMEKISSIYENIKLNEGIKDILKLLSNKNIKIALASSSNKKEIESVLNKNQLKEYFDFIITGDDVDESKPSPKIYNAVKKKYPKHKYYVIEDSKNGIKSAISAGMETILYNPQQKEINIEVTYEICFLKQIKKIVTEIELNCFTVAKAKEITLKVISYEPNINTQQKNTINKLWNDELTRKQLFNGKIVSYKSHKKTSNTLIIECFITQYKYFFAQLKNSELNLEIIPIGVSGIIIDKENNTLLAIRHNVTEYEGFYEFLPAGSIDSSKRNNTDILFKEQLITEFKEETKITKDCIHKIEPCCLIFDKNHKVYDICSKIYIKGLISDLLESEENEEYRNIKIINISNYHNKIKENSFVPTSVVIFNNI